MERGLALANMISMFEMSCHGAYNFYYISETATEQLKHNI